MKQLGAIVIVLVLAEDERQVEIDQFTEGELWEGRGNIEA